MTSITIADRWSVLDSTLQLHVRYLAYLIMIPEPGLDKLRACVCVLVQ